MSQAALNALASSIKSEPVVGPATTGEPVTMRLTPDLGGLTLPLPTGIIPVSVRVNWTADGQYKKISDSRNEASFILAPNIVSQQPVPADEQRTITADITLTATEPAPIGTITSSRQLAETVRIPVVLLPSVLVLCNHKLFEVAQRGGVDPCMLIVVPIDAGYPNPDTLLDTLGTIKTALTALNPHFSSLPEIGSLTSSLSDLQILTDGLVAFRGGPQGGATPHLIMKVADPLGQEQGIANLEHSVRFFSGQTGEDTFSSGMLTGLEVKALLFNGRENRWNDGVCEIAVPPSASAVRITTLHAIPPITEPSGCGRTVNPPKSGETFGDRMSSLLFPVS
jgi:hypothetical protein